MAKPDKQAKPIAGFGQRMESAAAAKKALLEKFRANAIDVNDPAFQAQLAARQQAAALRSAREAQRKAEKDAAKQQALAERRAAQLKAEQDAETEAINLAAAALQQKAAEAALAEQQKAQRDARYAARKARK